MQSSVTLAKKYQLGWKIHALLKKNTINKIFIYSQILLHKPESLDIIMSKYSELFSSAKWV